MPRLPALSGEEVIGVLEKIGYHRVRQRGSHIRLACPHRKSVTVPNYPVIGRGLLRKLLRDVELSPAEFDRLIK